MTLWARCAWLGSWLWLGAVPALAQDRLVVEERDPQRAQRWRGAATQVLRAEGVRLSPSRTSPAAGEEGVEPARLAVLSRAEKKLRRASEARAQMDEAAALRALGDAERALLGDLSLPGLSRWLAEVKLHQGIVAAQAGGEALARQAFEAAAVLDPERRLQAAEAPPAVVSLAWEVRRELRQRPLSRFRIVSAPAAARVFWDDEALGEAPVQVQTSPGRHLLRVQAPGHRPYAALVDALSGERRPVIVQLSPTSVAPPAPCFGLDERADAFAARVRAYSALHTRTTVWWLRPTPRGDRAGLWRCRRGHCERTSTVGAPPALRGLPLRGPSVSEPAAERPRDARVWPWVAVALTLAGGALAALLVTRPDPENRQTVVLDATAVGR